LKRKGSQPAAAGGGPSWSGSSDTLGDQPIAEIKKSDVAGLLDQIEAGELKRDGRPIVGRSMPTGARGGSPR
jgi:hypothetical protein